jgi:arylsulfatase A-like enzyme
MIRLLLISLMLATVSRAAPQPNLLVILADDMGWHDVGFAGNRIIETPHLDSLAKRGTVFTEACASAPNCAPTRACLLTGQYPPRHGVYTVVDERHLPGSPHHKVLAAESRADLPTEQVTVAEVLRDAGYATGMVGMWNLGRGRRGPTTPEGQGFGFCKQPKDIGFDNDAYRDSRGRELTQVMADECVSFIRANKGKPWFLYFAPHAVHAPYDPKPELVEKYRRREAANPEHAATVDALDASIGTLLKTLAELELDRNTLVIFTSDNGGEPGLVAPLRGSKGSLYQGGLRVPMVAVGPGVRPGARCDATVLSMDLFPTLLEFARVPLPKCDGSSLRPLLAGQPGFPERDLFWHFPCYTGRYGPGSVIRSGDWKLIEFFESGTSELYHLRNDPGELEDLSATEPARSKELLAKLRAWQTATKAPRPSTPNPTFDPDLTKQRGTKNRGPARTNKPLQR